MVGCLLLPTLQTCLFFLDSPCFKTGHPDILGTENVSKKTVTKDSRVLSAFSFVSFLFYFLLPSLDKVHITY